MILVEHGRHAHDVVSHSRYVEIEGSGHWPMLDAPESVVDELTAFVEETEPPEYSFEEVREPRRGPDRIAGRWWMGLGDGLGRLVQSTVRERIPAADLRRPRPRLHPGVHAGPVDACPCSTSAEGLERIPAQGPVPWSATTPAATRSPTR
ncbi:MAG: hypothetical protein U0R26_11205 [Solirubrobacterales bacterium]